MENPENLRGLFYIDDQILSMYLSQLSKAVKDKFYKDYGSVVNTDVEFSFIDDKVVRCRADSRLPYDKFVELLLHLEKHIFKKKNKILTILKNFTRKNKDETNFGNPETLEGRFVEGIFEVKYAVIDASDGIFIAYPKEGTRQRLEEHKKSFIILGDTRKCWSFRGIPLTDTPRDASPLLRLVSVWEEMKKNKHSDIRDDIKIMKGEHPTWSSSIPTHNDRQFAGGRESAFESLIRIESDCVQKNLSSTFKGLLMVRERFVSDSKELCILYPIFLKRVLHNDVP